MFIVICYDIADDERLRRVGREMENFGVRVQRSVFECHLDDLQLAELQERLARVIDPAEDRVRYYGLCPKDVGATRIDGLGEITRDWHYGIV